MADVKWIRLSIDMFSNAKIKYLRTLPEGNNIILIWVMLLTIGGRCNSNGFIFLTENIPYTTKILADELGFEESVIILSLNALSKLNMIQQIDDLISITGWDEHQNSIGLEKIREQNRIRQAKYKQRKLITQNNVTDNVTVTLGNAIELDKEIEKEIYKDIVEYLNQKASTNYKYTSKTTQKHINGRLSEGYTLDDFKKVIDKKVTEWNHEPKDNEKDMRPYLRPETLFGNKFESYLNQQVKQPQQPKQNKFNAHPQRTYTEQEYAEIERKLLNKG